MEYLNDDDQAEALKKWWQENGKAVIGGVVLGLAIVGGWQGWTRYSAAQAEQASAYFEQFSIAARSDDAEAARQQGARLLEEHGSSTYAVLAALELARVEYEAGQSDSAVARLRWVKSNASDANLAALATLRLAKVLLDKDDVEAAAQLVPGAEGAGAYAADYAVLRGDIARIRGDIAAARGAYQEALGKGVSNQGLVRMKLFELGGAVGPMSSVSPVSPISLKSAS